MLSSIYRLSLGAGFAVVLSSASCAQSALPIDPAIALLKQPGHHAVIRHALAPGMGDPVGFDLNDCSTQRNLGAQGRRQAVRLGEAFRAAGVVPTRLYASHWCRTRETAKLMNIGPVQDHASVNSVWTASQDTARRQSEEIVDMLSKLDPNETVVIVTHSVNISALTGYGTSSGAGQVIRLENGRVVIAGEFSVDID